jgi:predicted ArsR family transcriptional regulator
VTDYPGHPAEPAGPAITAVAALADGVRRGLYAAVRAADRPLTREEAAAAVGISRKLAAFHLDKLVEAGLLLAGARPDEHRVGRAPKAYRLAATDIRITIPPRRHDLLADILLDAVLTTDRAAATTCPADPATDTGPATDTAPTAGAGPATGAAVLAARERGRAAGAAEREAVRPGRLGAERAVTLAAGVLARHGFEPVRMAPDRLRLRTCPFHPLVARAPRLVCSVNHAFLAGLLEGLDAPAVAALPAPGTGGCCVELAPPRR